MKFLSKINRGLLLLIAILIAVTIYLIVLSSSQAKEKPLIKEVCQEYIDTVISYKKLPEGFVKVNPDIAEGELNKYIEDMNNDIKAFYSDNEETYKYLLARNKENLQKQALGMGVVFKYQKEILEFQSFDFDGKTVTVNLLTDTVLDGPNPYIPGSQRKSISSRIKDTITLQKSNGKWKVVYANLQDPMPENYGTSNNYED